MKKALFLIFLFIILFTSSLTTFAADKYKYQEFSNRMEGRLKVPHAGTGINLLSFVIYHEPLSVYDLPVLRIRFFTSQPSKVYITAVELRRHGPSHYHMKPLQTSWSSGCSFGNLKLTH